MKGSKMKKMRKRILAALLCTTMMLNTGMSAMADGGAAVSSESAHVHTEECYEKNKTDNLICTKAEAAEGHVHGDACYEVTSTPELICTQTETAGHTHGDGCVNTTKDLICGTEEHTHGGDCYKTETRDVCNDESEEHTCGDGCVETEEVLKCEKSEHTHDDGCYESETKMVCGQDEVEAHTHGEGCYTAVENKTLKCTLEEAEAHTHNDDCYAWEEKLVCTLPETAPAAEQPEKEEKAEEAEEAAEVNLQNDDETGIKVSVKSTSDVIPEDTKVVVASMEMDEEHEAALAEAVSEFEVLGYTAYDISLKDAEDEDITLGENKVEVAIDFEELIPEGINAEEVKDVVLVHITTDEEEKLTAETVGTVEITEEKATVEFEADSFSPYVVTYLSETEETVEEVAVEEPVAEDITLTYTSEDEAYTATVTGALEVLENVTAFEAVQVTDEEKITALTEQLTARAAEMQKTSLGFENYEFKFLDVEENEVSVNGEVKVSLSFAEERIPEAANAENVDAVLLETAEEGLEEINGLVSSEAGAVKEVVYTTEAPEELILAWSGDVYRALPNYEDDEVVITLAGTEYALQNVVGFNVTPIKEDVEETKEQYAEVAQQLKEKIAEENEAKEEEKEVVGFLAYDITLVDVEGNELEPQGGVRVSMEYKEAAAPEAVAEVEEAEVTIHHFEEDEKGEVKQIVDMVEEETIEATVEVTKAAEVEKVEFITGSFSIFTITWSSTESSLDGTAEPRSISGTVVTITGAGFSVSDDVIELTNSDSDVIRIRDINFEEINQGDATYVFYKAVVCEGTYTSIGAIDVASINYYNGLYRANNNEQYVISNDASGYSLYFVYLKANTIPTVDSQAENIRISLFDYTRYDDKEYNHDKIIRDINDGHYLLFGESGSEFDGNDDAEYNEWTGTNGGPRQGIVKNNLISGFPELKQWPNGGEENLGYLFNNNTVKYDANYLFTKQNGKFVYDSSKNFAELDTETNNFTVYDSAKVGFFPFNNFSDDISRCGASDSSSSESGSSGFPGGWYPGFGNNVDDTNHHFGMHVEFSFMQPNEGKVDGTDMIFKFNGDDDVWVFIDGMLVLDLGGIHEETGGTINFATGNIQYDDLDAIPTMREMYITAFIEQGKDEDEAENLADEYFEYVEVKDKNGTVIDSYYRFKNYSQHELDFFYLERGAYDSNCYLEFNLIAIPEDSVTIEKEISNYADGAYSDVEFFFEVYLQNGEKDKVPGTPNNASDLADTLMIVNDKGEPVKYEHIAVDGTRTNKTLGTDGVFKLKHKEQAIFDHLSVNTQFYVVEKGLNQKEYDNVEIVASDVLNEAGTSIVGQNQTISTRTLKIGTDHYAKFQNRCASTNMKYLSVEKYFDESALLEENPEYTFEVMLGGALYTGKYKVGTTYENAVASSQEYPTEDGIIKLEAGEVAVIIGYASAEDGTKGIPSGTSFKVREVELDLQSYVPPKYEVEKADDIETVNTKNGWASGKININNNAHVKVTNALRQAADSPEIKVSKKFSGLTQEQLNKIAQKFSITVQSKDTESIKSKDLLLSEGIKNVAANGDITFTWTLLNYPAGTYIVKENNEAVEGFENVIKINGDTVASKSSKEITTTAATIKYSQTTKTDSNIQGEYTVGNVNLIVAKLAEDAGYFIWTKDRISVNERKAIVDLIKNQFSTTVEFNKCYFYSDSISDTLVFRDGEITYDDSQKLTFDTTSSQWLAFVAGVYEVVGGDTPEIVVENIYTPSTIDIDLRKISINKSELKGAEFALYKYFETDNGWCQIAYDTAENVWNKVEQGEVAEPICVVNTTNTTAELIKLESGRYKLVEVKAPVGFTLLGDDIYFTVENLKARLTDAAGNTLTTAPKMWTLDEKTNVLTVKNDVLYELPSTGGHGIYTTMLSGFALMIGAAYVWFMYRRKEML